MSDCVNDWLRYLDRNQHAFLVASEPTTSEVKTLRMPDFIGLSAFEHRELWSGVEALSERDSLFVPAVNQLLECWIRAQIKSPSRALIDAAEILRLQRLYAAWSDPPFDRHRILSWLAANESEDAWTAFANIMATDPPQELRASVEALSPLWRIQKGPYFRLFPRILDAVAHRSVAAMVLDLTNYLVRSGRLATHPGHDRADAWTTLLGDVVARLESSEEVSRSSGVRDLNVAAQVTEAISLAISLTDSLTLLNHRPAMGKFYRLLGLEHRRLRVEAAAALARMEEPAGIDALQALAVEPLVRLRVHHYADELGLLDKIPVETRSPEAIAEAQLVVRLAEPDLFGVPPREWKLLDRRSLNWPGEEDPCECFLFQYHYGAEPGGWTSVAIAGPICHALPIDLTQLTPESIYAVYAGASVEHSELRRVPLEQTTPAQEVFIRRAVGQLHEAGFSEIQPVFLGMVFGAIALVASVRKGAQAGTAITEERMQTKWFPQWHNRAVDADAAYSIYLGQELLRHFNADFAAEDASDL